MTREELVKMWGEESNAANDCIIEILESCIRFASIVLQYAQLRSDLGLGRLASQQLADWKPILEHAKKAKEKANEK